MAHMYRQLSHDLLTQQKKLQNKSLPSGTGVVGDDNGEEKEGVVGVTGVVGDLGSTSPFSF